MGFCICFLCVCLGLSILYQGVKKYVRLCVFQLHHKANTSSCDDVHKFVHIVQYETMGKRLQAVPRVLVVAHSEPKSCSECG